MSKHTPPPWKWVQLEFSGYYHELHDVDGKVICDDGSAQGEYSPQIDVKSANARLIAAAPDLLEALENLENDSGSIPDHAWRMVLAAIAKAKGEGK